MGANQRTERPRDAERGMSIILVGIGMVVLLGILGLGVDLVSLYVGRSEAQRAADAAALAGASVFVSSGCTSGLGGCVAGGPQEALAQQQAITVGGQNKVGGVAPTILPAPTDIQFNYPSALNPTITVTVARDTTHGAPMPTFFMKIFGVQSANISASATAEAYNPSGGNIPVASKCLKPWLLPNCDYTRMTIATDPNANLSCPQDLNKPLTPYPSYFVKNNAILYPGPWPAGVGGELFTIKPGDPSQAGAPSQFYPIFLPPGSIPSACPSCATGGGGGGTGGAALYRQNIECCNQNTITCGQQSVQPITGNMVGPTKQGVDCLINESPSGSGQDAITFAGTSSTITAGSNNPFAASGTVISSSSSVVTAPVYDGAPLCPGASCPSSVNVNVVGFMQIFVNEETNPQGTVHASVMNVAACGAGGGGGTGGAGPISSGGASPIPIRLIHP